MVFVPQLQAVFDKYSSTGRSMTAGIASDGISTMNLEQLLQFNNEFHLNFWTKDCKEIFEEIKYKNDQQINFSQFQDALLMLSRKRFPHLSPVESLKKLTFDILNEKNPRKRYRVESSANTLNRSSSLIPRSVAINNREDGSAIPTSANFQHKSLSN